MDRYVLKSRKGDSQKLSLTVVSRVGLVLGLLFFVACQQQEEVVKTKEELIAEAVAEKVATLKRNLQKQCQERIMTEATARVDSILIARAKLEKDTIQRPPKPVRPNKPVIKTPLDTTPLVPLIKE